MTDHVFKIGSVGSPFNLPACDELDHRLSGQARDRIQIEIRRLTAPIAIAVANSFRFIIRAVITMCGLKLRITAAVWRSAEHTHEDAEHMEPVGIARAPRAKSQPREERHRTSRFSIRMEDATYFCELARSDECFIVIANDLPKLDAASPLPSAPLVGQSWHKFADD
jgi:hypothetical protein